MPASHRSRVLAGLPVGENKVRRVLRKAGRWGHLGPCKVGISGGLSAVPAAEMGQHAVVDWASSAAEEPMESSPAGERMPGKGSKHITYLCALSAGLGHSAVCPKATGRCRSSVGCAVPWAVCLHHMVKNGAQPVVSYVLWSHFALGNWGEALTFGDASTVQEWVS